ncbi:MAG: biotin/lipoyl-containing protein, partial [Bacteroidota bacterium]
NENPWERLQLFRKAMPNILLQMLLRGSNGVGYKAYPDNLIIQFIEKSAENGIDVFRIFDSLNWVEAMKVSIKTVRERTNSLAEACLCYTGDVLKKDTKYNLEYYTSLAKQFADEGAHLLAIKDMAGLLKPKAATELVGALKDAVDLPIHLHTHDTSSIQSTTYFSAIDAGVDVVDLAISSMSGLTSQPNFNSVVAALDGHPRASDINLESLNAYANYWEDVREFYYPFESGLKAGTAEVYDHEIPGGQYSNLRPQARSLGLEDRFEEVKKNYAVVNKMFGDIVKVTPSSKVVGDMALYMTANGLTPEDVVNNKSLAFPESVISLFRGELGQPHGGFPEEVSKAILKGEKPFTDRPNAHLAPIDFEKEMKEFQAEFDEYCDELDFLSYKLYPKVFKDFWEKNRQFGVVWRLPTPAFLYGLKDNEEIYVEIGQGKAIIIKKLYTGSVNENGFSNVYFDLNGQTRIIQVRDNSVKSDKPMHEKATGDRQVGAPIPGKIVEIKVKAGQEVAENDPLFVIEAMKMETTISAENAGVVATVHLPEGELVDSEDLIITFEMS